MEGSFEARGKMPSKISSLIIAFRALACTLGDLPILWHVETVSRFGTSLAALYSGSVESEAHMTRWLAVKPETDGKYELRPKLSSLTLLRGVSCAAPESLWHVDASS